jgi:hypothetical protein
MDPSRLKAYLPRGFRKLHKMIPKMGDFFHLLAANKPDSKKATAGMKKSDKDRFPEFVPPGHFFSPIPNLREVNDNERRIWRYPRQFPGIDLNEEEQLKLFELFASYYEDFPYLSASASGLRYSADNGAFSLADAFSLSCMIRHLHPKKIIEIGSGHSSCVTLDMNELFFGGRIDCIFVEPFPELFLSLLKSEDAGNIKLIHRKAQDVDLSLFKTLDAGDILFIDSTHVSKIDSDVNYLIFQVLPILNQGVHVHFHDVIYPFEYPRAWVYEGRAWNEAYLLRGFLQYNIAFKIVFFSSFLVHFFQTHFEERLPLYLGNSGASIWLRRA